jgi:hypothetical protein
LTFTSTWPVRWRTVDLLEALASFSDPFDSLDYQQPTPDVTDPGSFAPVRAQLAAYAED